MTIVLVALALGLGYFIGWAQARAGNAEVQRAAGQALAARIAVGQALPYLEQVEAARGPSEELSAAQHLLRALTWGSGRYWRHVRRGTYYEVLTYHLNLQTAGAPPVRDGDELVLYIDTRSGRLSARHPVEFHDGRFTRVQRSVALDADALAAQEGAGAATPAYVDQDRDLLRRLD